MSTMFAETFAGALLAVTGVATQPATLPATQPAEAQMGALGGAIMLAAMFVGLGVFIVIRAWDPARVSGPIRYPLDRPATGPVLLAVLAAGIYLGAQVLAGILLAVLKMRSGQRLTVATMTPEDYAMIATVPGILTILLLSLSPLLAPGLSGQLGWRAGQLPRGIIHGVIGSAVAVPLVFVSSTVFEVLYRAMDYTHPQEHELLAMMRDAPSLLVRLALIGGAVIVAPLVEELVFRAFIQSALLRLFSRRRFELPPIMPADAAPMPPAETTPPRQAAPLPVLPYAMPALTIRTDPPTPLLRWTAILLTSLAFASLHPVWSWPMIFLLSLCLGYAYERTGNLWSNITIHLLFNATSTAIFLAMKT